MDSNASPKKGVFVAAGTDRFNQNELKIWGFVPLSILVSSKDTGVSPVRVPSAEGRMNGVSSCRVESSS